MQRRVDMINTELTKLYKDYWTGLRNFRKKHGLSGPLLMKLNQPKVRLFIVGHETYGGWGGTLKSLRNDYDFLLSKCLEVEPPPKEGFKEWKNIRRTYYSPFWRVVRDLNVGFGIDPNKESVAWSNLNRMDNGEKKPPYVPSYNISKEMIESFPLLSEEIRICKPKILVFFTVDRRLLEQTFDKVCFEKFGGFGAELLRVKIPGFKGKAYQMNHPGYIQRRKGHGLKYNAKELVQAILKDCKGRKTIL